MYLIDNDEISDKPLSHDLSLNFYWRAIDDDWIKSLDLPPARNRKYAEARASVLLNARVASQVAPGEWVAYSRRRMWWSTGRRYRNTAYTYATVVSAVDELTRLGLFEHDRKRPGNLGWQSRFRATPVLQQLDIPHVIYDPVELIRLKDNDRTLIDYHDTSNTRPMRRRLEEINEAL